MDLASIVISVLALGVLVIIHEAGHYLAAVWGGMRVSRFSVGFGPALLTRERNGTVFQIGAIPFGGYVQIDGMHPEDGTDPDDPRSFVNRPRHLRAAAILAGPLANYLLAFGMLGFFYLAFATEARPPFEVQRVLEDSPAAHAGIQAEDVLVGVGPTRFEAVKDLGLAIDEAQAAGAPIAFVVERGGETLELPVTPEDGRIGIAYVPTGSVPVDYGPLEALGRAGAELWNTTSLMAMSLVSLVTAPSEVTVSGPVGIVKGLSNQVQSSLNGAFRLVAHLSIMLGFFNLLPIPALDGARLVFLGVGAIRRREVEPRLEAVVHGIGFLTLIGLMLVVSWFDLVG